MVWSYISKQWLQVESFPCAASSQLSKLNIKHPVTHFTHSHNAPVLITGTPNSLSVCFQCDYSFFTLAKCFHVFVSCALTTVSVSSSAVQQPDPNQPRPEGAEMLPVRGEALGVVTNWPPSLEAALQRWGTISPKAPCLTSLDTAGKPLYVLTYGNQTLLYFSQSFTLWICDIR